MELVQQTEQWVIKQEQKDIVKALDKKWLDDNFIAETLKHIVLNAEVADNKWNMHEDFKTKLSAITQIHKMKTGAKEWTNVNIAFFQPPWEIKY